MPNTQPSSNPTLVCDWLEWLAYLEHVDTSLEDKRAMIETVWSIVLVFVDLGWDVGAQPEETCGQTIDLRAVLKAAVVGLENQSAEEVV